MKIKCDFCPNELEVFGGLIFSPPKDGICQKRHICVECFPKLIVPSSKPCEHKLIIKDTGWDLYVCCDKCDLDIDIPYSVLPSSKPDALAPLDELYKSLDILEAEVEYRIKNKHSILGQWYNHPEDVIHWAVNKLKERFGTKPDAVGGKESNGT